MFDPPALHQMCPLPVTCSTAPYRFFFAAFFGFDFFTAGLGAGFAAGFTTPAPGRAATGTPGRASRVACTSVGRAAGRIVGRASAFGGSGSLIFLAFGFHHFWYCRPSFSKELNRSGHTSAPAIAI